MRLGPRLALLLLGTVLVATGISFLTERVMTERALRSFVFSGDAEKARIYAGLLSTYYSEKHSWTEVQSFLSEVPALLFELVDSRIHAGSQAAIPRSYPLPTIGSLLADRIVLVDDQGLVVADTSSALIGTAHPADHLSQGIPVMVQFQHRGTILVNSMIDSSMSGAASRLLGSLSLSLVAAAALSTLVALLLALPIALRAIRPLAQLTKAVGMVAAGELSVSVEVRGKDELAVLGNSFNAMTGELRRLEEAKRRLIADSAHELRTPVTLIRGSLEAVLDGIFPLDMEIIKNVHEETMRLSRLVDMLHELEIIDSGEMRLDLESLDLREVALKTAQAFAPIAGERDIKVSAEVDGAGPCPVLADPLRANEVLYNLVNNAVKYSPAGGRVVLGVACRPAEGLVQLIVEDSGPGIPEAERDRVFERFYRIDKSRSGASGGRGLGLAIAQEIMKAHGGRVSVGRSRLGGAAFVASFPRTGAPPNLPGGAPELPGLRS